jgi:MFS family permease
MGLTQGLFAKLVADSVPDHIRGTAFGIFNLINGMALLLASTIAGILWNTFNAQATFYAGAVFAFITLSGLLLFMKQAK